MNTYLESRTAYTACYVLKCIVFFGNLVKLICMAKLSDVRCRYIAIKTVIEASLFHINVYFGMCKGGEKEFGNELKLTFYLVSLDVVNSVLV